MIHEPPGSRSIRLRRNSFPSLVKGYRSVGFLFRRKDETMTIQLPEKIAANIEKFTGRKWLLPRILDWYENTSERLLLITGNPGTGKSMLAAWLANFGPPPDDPEDQARLQTMRKQVFGVHFCQAGGGSITPKNLSINLHNQLSNSINRFDEAFTESLPELIRLEARQRIGQVAAGAQVEAKNVNINNLQLGDFGDETSFFRLLHDPLVKLYQLGYDQPMLFLVDSLDEAATYALTADRPQEAEREKFTILDLLNTLKDLPRKVRILATLRPDERLLKYFFGAKSIDLDEDSIASRDDVQRYAFNQLDWMADPDRSRLADKVAGAAEGIFLYADLVVGDLKKGRYQDPLAEEFKFPAGMTGYYHESLTRELGAGLLKRWEDEFSPLLGLVAVSQADGLKRTILENIRGEDITPTLAACMQYLDGNHTSGPYRPFHKSFTDFLLEDEANKSFHINAWIPNAAIADHYWGSPNGKPNYSQWDDYAYRYLPSHLAAASLAAIETTSHLEAARLVRLVTGPDYQKRHQAKVKDFSQLQRQLEMGMQVALIRHGQEALPLVVSASVGMFDFHQANQRPGRVFDLADNGQIDEALRQLNMLKNVEPFWEKVTVLLISWLAAGKKPEQARQLYNQVVTSQPFTWPLEVLARRVAAAWGEPLGGLPLLPQRVPVKVEVEEILKRAGGQSANESMISEHLNTASEFLNEAMLEAISQEGHTIPDFLANQDGLPLVAYAVQHPEEEWVFESYLRIHTANRYVQYRNLSLHLLSDAVLRHPNPEWTLKTMRQLAESALSRGGVDFTEALPITRSALAALANIPGSRQELDQMYQAAHQRAGKLSPERNKTDQWGEHKRRLAALALAYHRLGDEAASQGCLKAAFMAPDGFAGYMVTAWLNLAEVESLVDGKIKNSTELRALMSAQNIQDSIFCAWATARVNAMLTRSWHPAGLSVSNLVERFSANPSEPLFAPFHIVRDGFDHRDRSLTKVPLRASLQEADTLRALAGELGASLEQLSTYNPSFGLDQSLPTGTRVFLPDPAFIPLLAVRLAGEVMLAEDLFPEDKQPLIQKMINKTLTDRTALDTILARLLLAAEPDNPQALQEIGEVYG
jgi:hypothetical protein